MRHADRFTSRNKQVTQLLHSILETQPKQVGDNAGGKTREETVLSKCQELSNSMPGDYSEDGYEAIIIAMGGFQIPLNIFLFQELQR